MWDIKDLTGTLYTQHDTELDHLLQSIYWLDNQQWETMHNIIPWEYHNIVNCLKSDIQAWSNIYNIYTSPVTADSEMYCSVLTSQDDTSDYQKAWSFMRIWDLQLHDAAVTYTFKAANANGYEAQTFATIACSLWQYSRQLRIDANRPGCQSQIVDVIYPNLK